MLESAEAACALADVLRLPVDELDADMLFHTLSGILALSQSVPDFSSTSPPTPHSDASSSFVNEAKALLSLYPHPRPYSSTALLRRTAHIYLQLLVVLPQPLVEDRPGFEGGLIRRDIVEGIHARMSANAFGIYPWGDDADVGAGASGPIGPRDKIQVKTEDAATTAATETEANMNEMLGYGIWSTASFFNHSCEPNLRGVWDFSATRDIAEGESLCNSYLGGDEETLSLIDRRRRLQNAWGFVCRCLKCEGEDAKDAQQEKK